MQILFQFDVRTVALFVAMTFFVQAMAIGSQAFLIRELKQYRGVGAVLLANLCVAAGLMLRLFVNRLPGILTGIPPNALLLAGLGLFYIALSQFTGLPYSKTYVLGAIAIVVVFLSYFTYWDDNIGKRIITLSLGSVAMVCILIYQLWRTQKDSLRLSANLMLVSFLVYGMFMIIRTINIIVDPPQDTSSFTPAQSATYLLSLAISLFWSTGFILMVSQRLRNDLLELATIDILTRIPNRRATEGFLEKELSRARRTDSELSVLLIDVDDFKQVNDRWGHAVGDHVLARTAGIFQSILRKEDWVGRWGGEEFLVVVPSSADCNPEALAERLRSEVTRSEYTQEATSFHVTVSIGVACADRTSVMDEVLKQADDALYKAKITKNAVSIAKRD